MNYFDDYYNDPQPRQEESGYIPPKPKAPKERKGLRRVVSVLLVLALVLGSCGATAVLMNQYWKKEMHVFGALGQSKFITRKGGYKL